LATKRSSPVRSSFERSRDTCGSQGFYNPDANGARVSRAEEEALRGRRVVDNEEVEGASIAPDIHLLNEGGR
jgi:hypothetical protein